MSVKTFKTMTNKTLFGRRLGAMLYDALLVFSVLLIMTLPVMIFTAGEAVNTENNALYKLYLFMVIFLYFAIPWTKSGQTLGMQSWKIKVVNKQNEVISWKQASLRFFIAIFALLFGGLGFFWILIDKDKLSWHDRISQTKIVYVSPVT